MPIINPDVQAILRAANIDSKDFAKKSGESLDDILMRNNLGLEANLTRLVDIAEGGDSSTVRLRAVEMGLKLNGTLKDQVALPTQVNIIINDSFNTPNQSERIGINPILVPRTIQAF